MLTIRHVAPDQVRTIRRDDIAAALDAPGFVWIDLTAPTDEEESVLWQHPVDLQAGTVEDMREDRHLPKVEVLGDELSMTVHGIALEPSGTAIDTVELDIALTDRLLVTFHEEPLAPVEAVGRRLDERGPEGRTRPVELLHLVLDTLHDVFLPFFDHIEQRLDIIEEEILADPSEATRRDIYQLQRDVIRLRRVVVPQAEVLRRLGREPVAGLSADDQGLFRDLYDHLYRMAELSDSYRQLLGNAVDSYRSVLDDRLNDMLRVLTLVSAALIPLTVIVGVYGMNFQYMPELRTRWGYFVVLAVMLLIVVSMVGWFRHRGWIGRDLEEEAIERRRRAGLDQVLEVRLLGTVLRAPALGLSAVFRGGRHVARKTGSIIAKANGPTRPGGEPSERQPEQPAERG